MHTISYYNLSQSLSQNLSLSQTQMMNWNWNWRQRQRQRENVETNCWDKYWDNFALSRELKIEIHFCLCLCLCPCLCLLNWIGPWTSDSRSCPAGIVPVAFPVQVPFSVPGRAPSLHTIKNGRNKALIIGQQNLIALMGQVINA